MKPIRRILALIMLVFSPLGLSGCKQMFEAMPHKNWGFIDKNGEMVIPAKFDDVARDLQGGQTIYQRSFRNFSEGLCAVRLGKKWGYINKTGKFVIQPKYDNAGSFSEGLACVHVGTKYGYIDKTGKEVIPLTFEWPNYSGQVASDNPDWDFSKELLLPMEFSDGLAVARNGKSLGYIDRTGKPVIDFQYSTADPFRNGQARVSLNFAWMFIDKTGKVVLDKSQHAIAFSEDLYLASAGVPGKNRKLFYLDQNGKRAFPGEFDDAREFSEGLALVAPQFKGIMGEAAYGYIDKTGKFVIKPQFTVAGNHLAANFKEGRAIVSKMETDVLGNIRYSNGIIDRTGKFIVKPKYDHISSYSDGLARASLNNNFVFLDKDGNVKCNAHTYWANSFSEGLAAVMR